MLALASNFDFFAWVILPILIFLSRITDVTIGTVRLIFVARGMKYLAPIVGFFEVLIWLLAMGQIMKNLSNPLCYIAYAAGFATGNFVGMWIVEKLSLGVVLIRVITKRDSTDLIEHFKQQKYGLTIVDGHGKVGEVKILFTIVPRKEVNNIVAQIKVFNPRAFYSIEEVGFVEKEALLPEGTEDINKYMSLFRPFRKGK
ncbi:MAG: DUF2179 domain-containing protein [Phycisphaerae bacterium]|nr:DUF2179 domain-containing protein [Phycisphaerae bacterium]